MKTTQEDKEMISDFIKHYGVKGMKWGRRKSGKSRVHGYLKKKYPLHSNPKKELAEVEGTSSRGSTSRKKKSVKDLSDTELREAVNRLNMEKQYKSLTKPQRSASRKFVEEVLVNAAKKTASNQVSKGMDKAAKNLIDEMLKNKK